MTTMSTPEDIVEVDETVEELQALLQAIKFAHPNYTLKQVHKEVQSHQGKWSNINIKRVKKHLKNLGLSGQLHQEACLEDKNTNIRITTIGRNLSVSEIPSKNEVNILYEDKKVIHEKEWNPENWKPVRLDVPAMNPNKYPYQGILCHIPEQTEAYSEDNHNQMGEIFKIQVAADGESLDLPMLLYNTKRNRKTFVHADSPLYKPAKKLVCEKGITGPVGGHKAYFWGLYSHKDEMLYVNIKHLAPEQKW